MAPIRAWTPTISYLVIKHAEKYVDGQVHERDREREDEDAERFVGVLVGSDGTRVTWKQLTRKVPKKDAPPPPAPVVGRRRVLPHRPFWGRTTSRAFQLVHLILGHNREAPRKRLEPLQLSLGSPPGIHQPRTHCSSRCVASPGRKGICAGQTL